MPDIAQLGFKTDTSDLDKADKALKRVAANSNEAEKASDKLGTGFKKTSAQGKVFGRSLNDVGGAAKAATGSIKMMAGALAAIAISVFSFDKMITSARELSAAVAELSTLLPTASAELDKMTGAAFRFALQYGTSQAAQVSGFYQAVSAGASSAAQSIAIMDNANKLAIGGITNVTTGVDILTTATNAYAREGLAAADASDTLFVGMKAGKTTISQLASGLGNVIPIAASLGIQFDELVAGTAALTTQGISTSSAIASLRAILTAVAKPTKEASDTAHELGINFSASALASKGLSGFLADVIQKSGGSTDALALLFGSVEALNGVLAFAGAGGQKFNDILKEMEARAGATDEAVKKVTESLDFRLNKILNAVGVAATTAGNAILWVMVVAIETLVDNIRILKVAAIGITPVLIGMFGPALLSAIGTFITLVGVGAVGAVRALTLAIMANPFGALAVAITTTIAALIEFTDLLDDVPKKLLEMVRGPLNIYYGAWIGAYKGIVAAWGMLPAALGDIAIRAGNAMLENLQNNVNSMIDMVNEVSSYFGGPMLDKIDITPFENKFAGAADRVGDAFKEAFSEAVNTDWVGKAIDAFGNLTGKTDELADSATNADKAFSAMIKNAIGAGSAAAKAAKDAALRVAETSAKRAAEEFAAFVEQARVAAENVENFFSSTTKSFITDFVGGLKRGEGALKSLGNAALNVLNKIADKMLDQALSGLFGGTGSSAIGQAVGRWLGFGNTASPMMTQPMAKGGVLESGRITAFASGGIVSSPTVFPMANGMGLMGEAGAEAIMPLSRGRGGRLGVSGGAANVNIEIVDQRGANAPEIKQESGKGPDGTEFRRFIISAVQEATVNGQLDNANQRRFGSRPQKVVR